MSVFAPQFFGYHQHDAHELLCYILDGLHEDLNRVKTKPYFEDLDENGKPDDVLASESWERYTARNQSIIVDLMHGQYKSTLFCPCCKNYSHRFDPFNSISLPIPQSLDRKMLLYFIRENPFEAPIRMGLDVTVETNLAFVRHFVSNTLKISANTFVFVSVVNDIVREILNDDRKVETLKSVTIFAYEEDDYMIKIPIEVEITKEKHKSRHVAFPRLVFVGRNTSFKAIHIEILKKVRQYIEKFREMNPKNLISKYEKQLSNPIYNLYFVTTKEVKCPLCKNPTCNGCQLPYSNDLYELIHSKIRVIIELR